MVLDVCKDHGLWFDRDELRQVLAFIEGGGLEKSHLMQAQEEEERRRMPRPDPPAGAWTEVEASRGRSGDLISAFEALINWIR